MAASTVARRAVLSLGSNLGERMDHLQGAVDALFDADGLTPVALSPVYETAPVGGPDQGAYLNAIVVADSALDPDLLLERTQNVELAFHREREVRWGPRTLDIDIITYGDEVRDSPALTLPHPRAHERAFVLRPWADADAEAAIPGRGSVRSLLDEDEVAGQHLRRRDDLVLRAPE
ncbi:2-amino-4-hydroxy-6-hydroxymethyldihydropteridine diphosphokinase [Lipingzhangella halophila]|uniref:2-amino-4-hydroxy-6-hydroxymethyldihydropteridine diphosphokinase n=1 Tax=Lipingzhangella halophila TaxID=1783352 RepID=A0A7W7W054_9ACTN|nr:2-amino-4-hydroxy-6-hydroxymethyldihydropteridine diphosphokinase [Lipingzhangella halophila]MBB4929251.1 2-amino-4-hydroxy-6-hydroxymethyldihydropteridine diphosphokinase [Lipingzhangella halophila]